MIKTDRFYFEFTDNIKEPRKTKVENMLSKLCRDDNKIYNVVDYLCMRLLDGCYLEKEEGYTYMKRDGEYSKPKNLYKFYEPEGRMYTELNKTQYDFVEYLIDNGINTEQAMEKAIADHRVCMEEQKRLQEENERAALEKAEQERKISETSALMMQCYNDMVQDGTVYPVSSEKVDSMVLTTEIAKMAIDFENGKYEESDWIEEVETYTIDHFLGSDYEIKGEH